MFLLKNKQAIKKSEPVKTNLLENHDDIRILNFYIETDDNRKCKYFVYKLQLKDEDTGEWVIRYKAISFYRLKLVPRNQRENKNLISIQNDVLSSLWREKINFVTLIAHIKMPYYNLLYCYGTQGLGDSLEEAKQDADLQIAAVYGKYQGSFSQIQLVELTSDEAEWIRRKLNAMNHLSVVRGIPVPRRSSGKTMETTFLGGTNDKEVEEQLEEVLRGMKDSNEFIYMLMLDAVEWDNINSTLYKINEDLSLVKSRVSGSGGFNMGMAIPIGIAGSIGDSTSTSTNYGESLGYSQGDSYSYGVSDGTSYSHGTSNSYSTDKSHDISSNVGEDYSQGKNVGLSMNTGYSENIGESTNFGSSYGTNKGTNYGHSFSTSEGNDFGQTVGVDKSSMSSSSKDYSASVSEGSSSDKGLSTNNSASQDHSYSQNSGKNSSTGVSEDKSFDKTNMQGSSYGAGLNVDKWTGGIIPVSLSFSKDHSSSDSSVSGTGVSYGNSTNTGEGISNGSSSDKGTGTSLSEGTSRGSSKGWGSSVDQSSGVGYSQGSSSGQSFENSQGNSFGESAGSSQDVSTDKGFSRGYGKSEGTGLSLGSSDSYGMTRAVGVSNSISEGFSKGTSESFGTTKGTSQGYGKDSSQDIGYSSGNGITKGISTALNISKSLSPSIGYSESYGMFNEGNAVMAEIIEAQRDRFKLGLREGAFITSLYLLTPDEESRAKLRSLSQGAFFQPVFPKPIEVLDLPSELEIHLKVHATSFSPCGLKEYNPDNADQYMFSTILMPNEITSYCHLPRVEMPGLDTTVENIPMFSVPSITSMDKGDIYLGKIVSSEIGRPIDLKYYIHKQQLMHTLIAGASGSGKTVAALRAVSEITNNLGMGAIILDWKKDWRVLLHTTLDKSRFKFYSLGNPNVNPIRLNLLAIPKNVDPEVWRDTFTEAFCLAYGLGTRGYTLINQALTSLYDEARVMENPANSHRITIGSLLERLKDTMDAMGRDAGFDTKDAFQRILDRLQQYQFGRLKEMYGTPENSLNINDLVEGNKVVVLEGLGLDSFQKQFIIGLISAGIFLYGSNNSGFHNVGGKLLVFEEAHQVVKGKADSAHLTLDIPETIYEIMFNEARGLGLNIIAISQQPSHMPDSVIANCSNLIVLRLAREKDVEVMTEAMAKDAKRDNRDIKRWLMRALVGWALIRLGRQFTEFAASEPVLIKIDPLEVAAPTDYELNESAMSNAIEHYLKSYQI